MAELQPVKAEWERKSGVSRLLINSRLLTYVHRNHSTTRDTNWYFDGRTTQPYATREEAEQVACAYYGLDKDKM